jgi:adenine phosphoribosyltransferase
VIKAYLRLVDIHTPGPRNDVTPLFADAEAFGALVKDISAPFFEREVDLVAGIDALGFILGTAVALHLGKGFVPVRKGGKLPVEADRVMLFDYSGARKSLELRKHAIHAGSRVLIVDEWVETGAQMGAAGRLIEAQGGVIAGIAAIQIDDHPDTQTLRTRYFCHSVWQET